MLRNTQKLSRKTISIYGGLNTVRRNGLAMRNQRLTMRRHLLSIRNLLFLWRLMKVIGLMPSLGQVSSRLVNKNVGIYWLRFRH